MPTFTLKKGLGLVYVSVVLSVCLRLGNCETSTDTSTANKVKEGWINQRLEKVKEGDVKGDEQDGGKHSKNSGVLNSYLAGLGTQSLQNNVNRIRPPPPTITREPAAYPPSNFCTAMIGNTCIRRRPQPTQAPQYRPPPVFQEYRPKQTTSSPYYEEYRPRRTTLPPFKTEAQKLAYQYLQQLEAEGNLPPPEPYESHTEPPYTLRPFPTSPTESPTPTTTSEYYDYEDEETTTTTTTAKPTRKRRRRTTTTESPATTPTDPPFPQNNYYPPTIPPPPSTTVPPPQQQQTGPSIPHTYPQQQSGPSPAYPQPQQQGPFLPQGYPQQNYYPPFQYPGYPQFQQQQPHPGYPLFQQQQNPGYPPFQPQPALPPHQQHLNSPPFQQHPGNSQPNYQLHPNLPSYQQHTGTPPPSQQHLGTSPLQQNLETPLHLNLPLPQQQNPVTLPPPKQKPETPPPPQQHQPETPLPQQQPEIPPSQQQNIATPSPPSKQQTETPPPQLPSTALPQPPKTSTAPPQKQHTSSPPPEIPKTEPPQQQEPDPPKQQQSSLPPPNTFQQPQQPYYPPHQASSYPQQIYPPPQYQLIQQSPYHQQHFLQQQPPQPPTNKPPALTPPQSNLIQQSIITPQQMYTILSYLNQIGTTASPDSADYDYYDMPKSPPAKAPLSASVSEIASDPELLRRVQLLLALQRLREANMTSSNSTVSPLEVISGLLIDPKVHPSKVASTTEHPNTAIEGIATFIGSLATGNLSGVLDGTLKIAGAGVFNNLNLFMACQFMGTCEDESTSTSKPVVTLGELTNPQIPHPPQHPYPIGMLA